MKWYKLRSGFLVSIGALLMVGGFFTCLASALLFGCALILLALTELVLGIVLCAVANIMVRHGL